MRQWLARRLGLVPLREARASRKLAAQRAYAAAQVSRLTADWPSTAYSADRDIRDALSILRSRARDLTQNNDHGRRYIQLLRMNVPGPRGFNLQVKAFDWAKDENGSWYRKYDEYANRVIEEAWYDWAKDCSVTGNMTLREVQHLLIAHAGRDGEFIVRKIRRKSAKYGFLLQVLEPDWLDEKKNEQLANGNIIRMGIEFDSWRKPVAYYIVKRDPNLELYASSASTATQWERVPAEEIYFGFDRERAYQSRGVPWFSASMLRLKMLSGYEEAALINARVSAAKMGFFHSAEGQGAEYTGDDTDGAGNYYTDAEPGRMEQLPPGLQFTPWDPKFPSDQHDSFVKGTLRAIASGLGVAASSLSGDLSDVNYSSIRAGIVEERENWKSIQEWFIESFLEPVFRDWLEMALLSGMFNLQPERFEKYNKPVFSGRRWSWVDPEKDVDAKIKEIQAGAGTLTQWLAEQGEDVAETLQQRAKEKDLAVSLGLKLSVDEPPKSAAPVPTNGKATNAAKSLIN